MLSNRLSQVYVIDLGVEKFFFIYVLPFINKYLGFFNNDVKSYF